jgi:hypothetical protein
VPPLREQWAALARGAKAALIGVPLVVVAVVTALSPTFGLIVAVLVVGMGLATATYVKNRADRLNALSRDDRGS